ncbi:MAG: lysozyme [Rhodoferax sp.]|nr:lysozyme [Rhodoferax sp.]
MTLVIALCKAFEGFRARPYLCPAGKWTIGFGSTFHADGRPVKPSDPPITQADAEALLRLTLERDYLPGVVKASPGLLRFPRALAAIVDFAYNAGVPRYRASTLRRRVDECDWGAAKVEAMRWTRGGGKVLPGLVKRCEARAALL